MMEWDLDKMISSDPYLQGYYDGVIEALHTRAMNKEAEKMEANKRLANQQYINYVREGK